MKQSIFVAILFFFAITAFAQSRERHHHHHGKGDFRKENPALEQALQAHFELKVYPVLKEKKAAFEKNLSKKQRKELEKLREKGAALKAERVTIHEQMKAARDAGKEKSEIRQAMDDKMSEHKIAQVKFHEEVLAWIDANETQVTAAMEALKPLKKQWHEEKKAIFEANRPEGAAAKTSEPEGGKCEHQKGKPHHGSKEEAKEGHHGMHPEKAEMEAIKFVLWNGELPKQQINEKNKVTTTVLPISLKLSAYPNPAKGLITVKFDLPNDTKLVELLITNSSGETVKKLIYNDLIKGEQEVQVDITTLSKGQYFYTIVADGIKKTEKLMVE